MFGFIKGSRLASRLSTQIDSNIDATAEDDWPTSLSNAIKLDNGAEIDDHCLHPSAQIPALVRHSRAWFHLRYKVMAS